MIIYYLRLETTIVQNVSIIIFNNKSTTFNYLIL
jgi:hypothetical protein